MITKLHVALAGNPNSGKTTVFNNLTGSHQHVGNYPGVTVEKKEGTFRHGDMSITVVDLPGTYSLTAYSVEELVARDFLLTERPDVVVDVLDASNLERNLYLAVQLIELGIPLVLALNMSDMAKARGVRFDLDELSRSFGAPIVPTIGHRNKGTQELIDAIMAVGTGTQSREPVTITYGQEVEDELRKICDALEAAGVPAQPVPWRWLALKLLEGDERVAEQIAAPSVHQTVARSIEHLQGIFGESPEAVIPDRRYGYISGACQEAVQATVEARHNRSDRIDTILLSRALGLPIFLVLMYLVFHLTFTAGALPMEWLEALFGWLGTWLVARWPTGSDSALLSLLVDGIIGGVGGVVVFLPNIMLLFLAIAILEDSGYMARAAFLMDVLMHRIGLHGKSFIPMLIGFGCSVPAILATRILENRRDRLTTILVLPLMSCGARLPIYALIIPAFFPSQWHGPMLWIVYCIGICLAIAGAKVLRTTLLRGVTEPLVMELPPYRVPTLKGTFLHMWERSWLYLKKAGTVILAISILLWVMTSYPKKRSFDRDYAALTTALRTDFEAGARDIAGSLGLDNGTRLLDMDLRRSNQPTPADSAAVGLSLDSSRYADFAELCRRIHAENSSFENAVQAEALRAEEDRYLLLAHRRDTGLLTLHAAHPEMYDSAVRFLDRVKLPYERGIATLAAEQRVEALTYSVAGRIGLAVEPIIKPLGFDWRIGTALIGALAAKEVFVAQLGIVHAVGGEEEDSAALREKLRRNYSPLVGFCIMLFCLISAPCIATVVVCGRESGSWRWAALQLLGLTTMAYVATLVVYQAGRLLQIGI